jgi:hypothetical protein
MFEGRIAIISVVVGLLLSLAFNATAFHLPDDVANFLFAPGIFLARHGFGESHLSPIFNNVVIFWAVFTLLLWIFQGWRNRRSDS